MLHILPNSIRTFCLILYTVAYREFYYDMRNFILSRNLSWLVMRKLGRFNSIRNLMFLYRKSRNVTYPDNDVHDHKSIVTCDTDVDSIVNQLKEFGVFQGLYLHNEVVESVSRYTKNHMCYANRDKNYGFYYPNHEAVARTNGINVSLATYYEVEKPCQVIANLKYDPLILNVASKYLGGKPVHQGTKLWWSFPANLTTYEAYVNAQCYHYDLDDYSACKFFFYFTDVHIHDGPHMCVIKTHKRKSFLHKVIRGYYSDRQVQDYYGMENVETIYGPPGFGFVEDAFCLHKGQLPVQNDRLILSIEFALRDYGLQHEVQREASDDFVKPIWARHSRRPKASRSTDL